MNITTKIVIAAIGGLTLAPLVATPVWGETVTSGFTQGVPTVVPAPASATPAISVAPGAAQPGTSATASAIFTADTPGDFEVTVSLNGTGGTGTFTAPTPSAGLSSCGLDASSLVYSCNWTGASTGDQQTIALPVAVGSASTTGVSWFVNACANIATGETSCIGATLDIVAPTPRTTPTPSVTPSPSASPSATPSPAPSASTTGVADSGESNSTSQSGGSDGTDGSTVSGDASAPELAGTGAFSGGLAVIALALVTSGLLLIGTRRSTTN
ncbi:hypothetical protein [Demequina aurantiaca]|uniref:hypothetical protein n=1 Tax=Demequina aurantiaca TaxID=676200 RepID=UPI000AB23E9A|nr:hypothetical protein [Demequina aurantiaca]